MEESDGYASMSVTDYSSQQKGEGEPESLFALFCRQYEQLYISKQQFTDNEATNTRKRKLMSMSIDTDNQDETFDRPTSTYFHLFLFTLAVWMLTTSHEREA